MKVPTIAKRNLFVSFMNSSTIQKSFSLCVMFCYFLSDELCKQMQNSNAKYIFTQSAFSGTVSQASQMYGNIKVTDDFLSFFSILFPLHYYLLR